MLGVPSIRDAITHSKTVADIRWNNDGSFLASASFDKNVKIGSLDVTGNVLFFFYSFYNIQLKPINSFTTSGSINQMCWHPLDDSILSVLGDDKFVELWDVRGNLVYLTTFRPFSKSTSF